MRRIGKKGVDNELIVGLVAALIVLGISLFFFRAMTKGVDYLPDQVCKFANTVESSSGPVRVLEGIGGVKNFLCKKRYRVIDVKDFSCKVFDKEWERECNVESKDKQKRLEWERRWAANQVMELVKRTWVKGLKGGETIDSFDSFTFRIKGFSDSEVTECLKWGYECKASCDPAKEMQVDVGSKAQQYSCDIKSTSTGVCCAQKSPPYSLEQTVPRFCASTDLVCLEGLEINDDLPFRLNFQKEISGYGTLKVTVRYNPIIQIVGLGRNPDEVVARLKLAVDIETPRLLPLIAIGGVQQYPSVELSFKNLEGDTFFELNNLIANLQPRGHAEVGGALQFLDPSDPSSRMSCNTVGICTVTTGLFLWENEILASSTPVPNSHESVVVVASLREAAAGTPLPPALSTICTLSRSDCYLQSEFEKRIRGESATAASELNVGERCIVDGNSDAINKGVGTCRAEVLGCEVGGSGVAGLIVKGGAVGPIAEICGNELDEDCDGYIDAVLAYKDNDRDTFGVLPPVYLYSPLQNSVNDNWNGNPPSETIIETVCSGTSFNRDATDGNHYIFSFGAEDCDDNAISVHPADTTRGIAAPQDLCDSKDNDCDGQTNEDFVDGIYDCITSGDPGKLYCRSGREVCEAIQLNICGGAGVLPHQPGVNCRTNLPGICADGEYVCDGADNVRCDPVAQINQFPEKCESTNPAERNSKDYNCNNVVIEEECRNPFEDTFKAVADFFQACVDAGIPTGVYPGGSRIQECLCNYNDWANGVGLSSELKDWSGLSRPLIPAQRDVVVELNLPGGITATQFNSLLGSFSPQISVAPIQLSVKEQIPSEIRLEEPQVPITPRIVPQILSQQRYFTLFKERESPPATQIYNMHVAGYINTIVSSFNTYPRASVWLTFRENPDSGGNINKPQIRLMGSTPGGELVDSCNNLQIYKSKQLNDRGDLGHYIVTSCDLQKARILTSLQMIRPCEYSGTAPPPTPTVSVASSFNTEITLGQEVEIPLESNYAQAPVAFILTNYPSGIGRDDVRTQMNSDQTSGTIKIAPRTPGVYTVNIQALDNRGLASEPLPVTFSVVLPAQPTPVTAVPIETPPVTTTQPPVQPSVPQLSLEDFIEIHLMDDVRRLGQFISDCGSQGDCVCRYSDWANNANPSLSDVLFTSMLDSNIDSSVKEEAVRRFSLKVEDIGGTGRVLLIPMLDGRNIETIEFLDVQNSERLVWVRQGNKNQVRIAGIRLDGNRYASIENFDNIIISPTIDGGYTYSGNVLNPGETSCDTFAITWGFVGGSVKSFVKCRNNIQSPIPTSGGFCTNILNNLPSSLSSPGGGTTVSPPLTGGTSTTPTQPAGTATAPPCTITDAICRDGADNECANTGNTEVDYDGGGVAGIKGDALCPVGVRGVSIEGGITQTEEGQPFTALCTTTVGDIRSISVAIYRYEGSNLVLEGYCNFDESRGWNGNVGPFNCNAGHYLDNRPKVVRCEVDTAKSYMTREEERYEDAAIEVTQRQQAQPAAVSIQEQFGDFAPFVEDVAKISTFISDCAASIERNCLCRYDRWAETGGLPTQVFSSVQDLSESIREDVLNKVLLSFTATRQGIRPGLVPDRTLTNQQVLDFVQNRLQLPEIIYPDMIDMSSGTARIKVSTLFTRRLSTDVARTQETELIYIRPNPAGGFYSFVDNIGMQFLDEGSSRHCLTLYIYKRDEDVGTRHVREDKFLGCDGSGRTQDIAGGVCSLGNSYTGTLAVQPTQPSTPQQPPETQTPAPQQQEFSQVVSSLQQDVNRLGQFFDTCAASPRTDACACSYIAFSHGQALFQTLNSQDISEEIKQQLVNDFRISIERTNNANTLSLIPRVSPAPQNQELANAIAQAFSQPKTVIGSEGFISNSQQINSLRITTPQITSSQIAVSLDSEPSLTIVPSVASPYFTLEDSQRNTVQCRDFLIFKDEQGRFRTGECIILNTNIQLGVPSCFELQGPVGTTVVPPPPPSLNCPNGRNSECSIPNARAVCSLDTPTNTRSCTIQQCNAGFVDVNQNVQDGCECRRSFPTLLGTQVQSREETFGEGVCRDGIDNDCDGLIDGEDEGCAIQFSRRAIRNLEDLRVALRESFSVELDDRGIQDWLRRNRGSTMTFVEVGERFSTRTIRQQTRSGREREVTVNNLNIPPSELQRIYDFFIDVPEAAHYVRTIGLFDLGEKGAYAQVDSRSPQVIQINFYLPATLVTLRHEFEHVMDDFVQRKENVLEHERPSTQSELDLMTLYSQITSEWLNSALIDQRFGVMIRQVNESFYNGIKRPLANVQVRIEELQQRGQITTLQGDQITYNSNLLVVLGGMFGCTVSEEGRRGNYICAEDEYNRRAAQGDLNCGKGEFENRIDFLRNFNIYLAPGATNLYTTEQLIREMTFIPQFYQDIKSADFEVMTNDFGISSQDVRSIQILRDLTFSLDIYNRYTSYFNEIFGYPESEWRLYGTLDYSKPEDNLCLDTRRTFKPPRSPIFPVAGDIEQLFFPELSASYTEVSDNTKQTRASSSEPAAKKLNRALAQLAYDAGKMNEQEYERIMSCNMNNDCGKCMLYKKTCIPEQN